MPQYEINPQVYSHLFDQFHPNFYPPKKLWVEARSEVDIEMLFRLPEQGFGIVGSRLALTKTEELIAQTLNELKHAPLVILSGLARGVDTFAHEYALQNDMKTIAFLGCGLHHQYPPENDELRSKIVASGGLIVSEFDPQQEPRPQLFAVRNRLIAAYSAATWVAQAGRRSGASLTANHILDFERTLYLTPTFPGDEHFIGNQDLFEKNPQALSFWSSESLKSTWLNLPIQTAVNEKLKKKIHSERNREQLKDSKFYGF